MKRLIFSLVFLSVILTACSRNMNNIDKEANFTGIVAETSKGTILVRVDEAQGLASDLINVSLDVELKDS